MLLLASSLSTSHPTFSVFTSTDRFYVAGQGQQSQPIHPSGLNFAPPGMSAAPQPLDHVDPL